MPKNKTHATFGHPSDAPKWPAGINWNSPRDGSESMVKAQMASASFVMPPSLADTSRRN